MMIRESYDDRIMLQDKVRNLKHHPREDDQMAIEAERTSLRFRLEQFSLLSAQIGQEPTNIIQQVQDINVDAFDDLEVEPGDDELPSGQSWPAEARASQLSPPLPPPPGVAASLSETTSISPENVRLALPSTSGAPARATVELTHRKLQAQRHLQNLREVIAEKSFLYSHVIRVAPKKAVRTRAHGNISKLNTTIAYLSRAYGRCRAAMIRLGVDQEKHLILAPEDVRASTAIRDPNEPGSTTHRLSWIWHATGAVAENSGALDECK